MFLIRVKWPRQGLDGGRQPMNPRILAIAAAFAFVAAGVALPATAQTRIDSKTEASAETSYPEKEATWDGQKDPYQGEPANSAWDSAHEECERMAAAMKAKLDDLGRQHELRRSEFEESLRLDLAATGALNLDSNTQLETRLHEFEASLRADFEALRDRLHAEFEAACGALAYGEHPEAAIPEVCQALQDTMEPAMAGLEEKWRMKLNAFGADVSESFRAMRASGSLDRAAFDSQLQAKHAALKAEWVADVEGVIASVDAQPCFDAMGEHKPDFESHFPSLDDLLAHRAPSAQGDRDHWKAQAHEDASRQLAECRAKYADDYRYQSRTSVSTRDGATATSASTVKAESNGDADDAQRQRATDECEERAQIAYENHRSSEAKQGGEYDTGSFDVYDDGDRISVVGEYLGLYGDTETQEMYDFTLKGRPYIASLIADGFLHFGFAETGDGTALNIDDVTGQAVMRLHDNPLGAIRFTTTDDVPRILLAFDGKTDLVATDKGFDIRRGDYAGALLAHGQATQLTMQDGNVVEIVGKAALVSSTRGHDAPGDAAADSSARGNGLVALDRAIMDNKVATIVDVRGSSGGVAASATELSDLHVQQVEKKQVQDRDGRVKNVIEAVVDSETSNGKFATFAIDKETVVASKANTWDVTIIDEDGTELVVDRYESVQELLALEPATARSGFAVYAELDANGEVVEHVIAMFIEHFSEKRIVMEPVSAQAAGADDANGLPGFEAGFVVAAIGLVLVGVAARRHQ